MLSWLKNLINPNKNPQNFSLVFSEKAISEIKSHLTKIHSDSAFLLQIRRDKKGNGRILTGFDKPGINDRVILIHGIRTAFSGKSFEILNGAGVDWDDNGNVLIYPGIEVYTEPTPNPMILAFVCNKRLLSEESELKYGAWERGEKVNQPLLIKKLFNYKYIQSLYLTKFSIQVEIKKKQNWTDHEEEIGNIIIEYLETLPDPIRLFIRSPNL